jgi:protein-disulfide isomerase
VTRRAFLACLALAAAGPAFARAEDLELAPLPDGADPAAVAGLSWYGSGRPAIEIFDYNCPYCRAAFQALDAMVAKKKLRLGLMDSPQLSTGSIQAAKIRQAVLILFGPDEAYQFHRRLSLSKGVIDGEAGLAIAQDMGLDVARVTEQANAPEVRDRIIAEARFLDRLTVTATPSFIIGSKLLAGWPGPQAFGAALKAAG